MYEFKLDSNKVEYQGTENGIEKRRQMTTIIPGTSNF